MVERNLFFVFIGFTMTYSGAECRSAAWKSINVYPPKAKVARSNRAGSAKALKWLGGSYELCTGGIARTACLAHVVKSRLLYLNAACVGDGHRQPNLED